MPNEPEPPSDEADSDIKRLNMELNKRAYECLLDVKEKSGATSLIETIRRALRLYQVVLDAEQKEGAKLILRTPQEDIRVIIT